MPQMQRQSVMWLNLLAVPVTLPEAAQVWKAQGCFGVAQCRHRGPVGPQRLRTELSQHNCSRALAPDMQRLKSPGSAGFDPVSKVV